MRQKTGYVFACNIHAILECAKISQGDNSHGLTCSSSLTLSIGATAVLEIAAATPPAKKSLAKEMAASAMAALIL